MAGLIIDQAPEGQGFLGWFHKAKFAVFGQTFVANSRTLGTAAFRLDIGVEYAEVSYRVLIKDLTTNSIIFTSANKTLGASPNGTLEYGDVAGFSEVSVSLRNTQVVEGRKYAFLIELLDGQAAIEAAVNPFNAYRAGNFVYGTNTTQLRSAGANDMVLSITEGASNQAPAAVADAFEVTQGGTVIIPVMANDTDPDAGDALSLKSIASNNLSGTADVTDTGVRYSTGSAFNQLAYGEKAYETFSYTIADRAGLTSTAEVKVTITGVNDPVIAHDDMLTVRDGDQPVVVNVLANDVDPDNGDTKTLVKLEGTSSVKGVLTQENGVVSYQPGAAFVELGAGASSTDTFTYQVKDAAGLVSSATVTITIEGKNDAIVAVADKAAVLEGGEVTLNLLANDIDPDLADSKTIASVNSNGLRGSLQWNADGTVRYSPGAAFEQLAANERAIETFSYTVADRSGGQSTATVSITVTGANDRPGAAADVATIAEKSGVVIDVLANDVDVDRGDTLRILSVDTTGTLGSVTLNDGKLTYVPGASFTQLPAGAVGTDSFEYTVADSAGLTDKALVSVTVTGVNDPVTAHDDLITVRDGDQPVVVNVLSNDVDPDTGDTKTVVKLEGAASVKGVLTLDNGIVRYQPGAAFEELGSGARGTDTFTYQVKDAAGLVSTATVTVTIEGKNDPIVAVANKAAVIEGGEVTLNLLTNDIDPDLADTKTIVSVNTDGLRGSLQWNADGTVRYSPGAAFEQLAANETAVETFTYTAADASGSRSTAIVSITVTGTNDRPVALADAATVDEKGTVVVDVLANDTDTDRNDVLALAAVGGSADGATVEISNGKLVYHANADQFDLLKLGESTTDTVSYTVRDAGGATATATLTVKIKGIADGAPVVTGNGADTLIGTSADEHLDSGNGNDILRGMGGADTLYGGDGDDVLQGGAGVDALFGENGNDILDGGLGDDKLTGGNGSDTFVIHPGGGHDVLMDFKPSSDRVQFDRSLFRDFAAVLQEATQLGADVLIECGDGSVRLIGIDLKQLNANIFTFTSDSV